MKNSFLLLLFTTITTSLLSSEAFPFYIYSPWNLSNVEIIFSEENSNNFFVFNGKVDNSRESHRKLATLITRNHQVLSCKITFKFSNNQMVTISENIGNGETENHLINSINNLIKDTNTEKESVYLAAIRNPPKTGDYYLIEGLELVARFHPKEKS